jgi:hypothetical protein
MRENNPRQKEMDVPSPKGWGPGKRRLVCPSASSSPLMQLLGVLQDKHPLQLQVSEGDPWPQVQRDLRKLRVSFLTAADSVVGWR